jgi:hypothetical protein
MIDDYDDLYGERPAEQSQRSWYLLTGLILGIVLGVLAAWVIAPVRYYDTSPASLAPAYQAEYHLLIARAYQASGDLNRARQRLTLFPDLDLQLALQAEAQQLTADDQLDDARALAALAAALAGSPAPAQPAAGGTSVSGLLSTAYPLAPSPTLDPAGAVRTPTASPTAPPTGTPPPTATPRATPTLRPTLPAAYRMISRQDVCDPALAEGLLQVVVLDDNSRPLPGVAVNVSWGEQNETFYTGLYPEISQGYADFRMQPGLTYSVSAGQGGERVEGLVAPQCLDLNGTPYLGGWLVQFQP